MNKYGMEFFKVIDAIECPNQCKCYLITNERNQPLYHKGHSILYLFMTKSKANFYLRRLIKNNKAYMKSNNKKYRIVPVRFAYRNYGE